MRKGSSFALVIGLVTLIAVGGTGAYVYRDKLFPSLNQTNPGPTNTTNTSEQDVLASKFDTFQANGCVNLNYSQSNIAGAKLIAISGPRLVDESYYNLPNDYWYNLTLQVN